MANAFPMMARAALQALIDSIAETGFNDRFPIVLHEGQVLDGRNRLAACRAADVEPVLDVLPPEADPATFAWAANAERRHLTDAARILARDRLFPPKRGRRNGTKVENGKVAETSNFTPSTHPADVARDLGTGRDTVTAVRRVAKQGPSVLVEAMTAGIVSPADAKNALAFEPPEIEAAVAAKVEGKARTVAGWARRQAQTAAAPDARPKARPGRRELAEAATTMARARWTPA